MFSLAKWSSAPTLSRKSLYACTVNSGRPHHILRRNPISNPGLGSTLASGSPSSSVGLCMRKLHSSIYSQSEDLWDFEKRPATAPKRRPSSSQSKTSSASVASSTSKFSRSRNAQSTTLQSARRSALENIGDVNREMVRPRKPTASPRVSSAQLSRIRDESSAIEFVPVSRNPLISETHVRFSGEKLRRTRSESGSVSLVAPQEHAALKRKILPTVVIEGLNPKYGIDSLAVRAAVRPASATDEDQVNRAKAISSQLGIPYIETASQLRQDGTFDFVLVIGVHHISLMNLEDPLSPHVFSDFITGPTAHRKSYVTFNLFPSGLPTQHLHWAPAIWT